MTAKEKRYKVLTGQLNRLQAGLEADIVKTKSCLESLGILKVTEASFQDLKENEALSQRESKLLQSVFTKLKNQQFTQSQDFRNAAETVIKGHPPVNRLPLSPEESLKLLELILKYSEDDLARVSQTKRLNFHIAQFDAFRTNAYDYLITKEKNRWAWPDHEDFWEAQYDFVEFQAEVMHVFFLQWKMLNAVFLQSLRDYPNKAERVALDKRVQTCYRRSYQALPPVTRDQLSPSSPLVFFGDSLSLTHFTCKAPCVLSVPLEELKNPEDHVLMYHEIGHAIFDQIPGLYREVSHHVCQKFFAPSKKQEAMITTIIGWLSEILPDLAATAIAFADFNIDEFARFVYRMMEFATDIDPMAGQADSQYPPYPILPYIYLKVADIIRSLGMYALTADEQQTLTTITAEVEHSFDSLLERRFTSLPALAYVSLREMKDLTNEVVEFLLTESLLQTLGNKNLGSILLCCVQNRPMDGDEVDWTKADNDLWGINFEHQTEEEWNQFALYPPKLITSYACSWRCCIRQKCPCTCF